MEPCELEVVVGTHQLVEVEIRFGVFENPQPITNCKPIIEYNAGKLSDAGVNGPHIKPTLGFRGIKEAGFGIYIVVEPDGDDDEGVGWLVLVLVSCFFYLRHLCRSVVVCILPLYLDVYV